MQSRKIGNSGFWNLVREHSTVEDIAPIDDVRQISSVSYDSAIRIINSKFKNVHTDWRNSIFSERHAFSNCSFDEFVIGQRVQF